MGINVLLADDHRAIRDGLKILLEAQPDILVVGCAADGAEAKALVAQLQPDVVVMDILMPRVDGITATQWITQNCPQVRVLMLSMYATIEHVVRALHAGAYGYLLKESVGTEVIEAVRSVYAGHHHLCRKISDMIIDEYLHQYGGVSEKGPPKFLNQLERETLQLLVEGKTDTETADILGISPKLVESYRHRLMNKLETVDLALQAKLAVCYGLTPLTVNETTTPQSDLK